jgi:hypothetical protein
MAKAKPGGRRGFPTIEPDKTCTCGGAMTPEPQRTYQRNRTWFSERLSRCACGRVVKKVYRQNPATGAIEKLDDVKKKLKQQIQAIESAGRSGRPARR